MSLESIKAEPGLASRVIAFNGRYATLPQRQRRRPPST
jgi:phospholipase/carboxylesterase